MKYLFPLLVWAACLSAQDSNSPNYTAAGIVNGASFAPGLAPNTIGSVFGTNLSWDTRGITSADIGAGVMPTSLDNVQLYLEGWPVYLYYVSPLQINFLVPNELIPGTFQFWVDRQGIHGPIVTVTLAAAAPALFQLSAGVAVATHLDWSVVSSDAPASAGEIISLWATGLGRTTPEPMDGALPSGVMWLTQLDQFSVLIDGVAVDPSTILYAGIAPGYAGLYQIDLRLPDPLPANPEIRLGINDVLSPAGMTLPAQ